MSFRISNWVSSLILISIALVETIAAIAMSERHSYTLHALFVMIGFFLAGLLVVWLKWPRDRRVIALCFVTILCGFATAGNLLRQHVVGALFFGSLLLYGVFLMVRELNRVKN